MTVVLAALCLLNLLLTLGIVRRLREHSRLLSERTVHGGPNGAVIGAGAEVPAVDGVDLTGGPVFVGFFSPGCQACTEQLPEFVGHAARFERVVAVVSGGSGDGAPYAAELRPVARVVVEDADGPMTSAFQVQAFPSWVLVDGPVVRDSAVGFDRLPQPVAG